MPEINRSQKFTHVAEANGLFKIYSFYNVGMYLCNHSKLRTRRNSSLFFSVKKIGDNLLSLFVSDFNDFEAVQVF